MNLTAGYALQDCITLLRHLRFGRNNKENINFVVHIIHFSLHLNIILLFREKSTSAGKGKKDVFYFGETQNVFMVRMWQISKIYKMMREADRAP